MGLVKTITGEVFDLVEDGPAISLPVVSAACSINFSAVLTHYLQHLLAHGAAHEVTF